MNSRTKPVYRLIIPRVDTKELKSDHAHQDPIDQAAHRAQQDGDYDGQKLVFDPRGHKIAGDSRQKGEHHACGQISPTGEHDKGDTTGDDAIYGYRPQQVHPVVQLKEGGLHDPHYE